ncbi:MAG: bifunctional oligoribonuclease/PAP phosphatase NrnA [Bacilli bacterium]|nr:bifunctional oligoribonuclease/PAP phosphatase NrnA [Bacilli bacterium]
MNSKAEVIQAIKEADSIVIVGHIRPDGDCYGSQMGLKDAIQTNFPEKKVYCVGSGLPLFFNHIGEMDVVPDEVIKNSLGIIVDLNEIERCEDQRVPRLAKKLIQIDHHIIMFDFKFPFYVDEDACSTCAIIAEILEDQKWKITEKGANALYLGILTDSARFEYVDDFPKVFRIAAYLCQLGAKPEVITRILSASSEKFLQLKGYALTHYRKKKGIIYLHLNASQIKKLGIKQSYGTAIINTIGNVNGYPIWATFFENEEHTCIIEFRSNKYNVCNTAMKYGGGGHMMAAGVTIKNFDLNILNAIIENLAKEIRENKK